MIKDKAVSACETASAYNQIVLEGERLRRHLSPADWRIHFPEYYRQWVSARFAMCEAHAAHLLARQGGDNPIQSLNMRDAIRECADEGPNRKMAP